MPSDDTSLDDEERLEELSEDNSPPAAPPPFGNTADDDRPPLGMSHPSQDDGLDATEEYDVGRDGASGAEPPRADGVVDYNPHQEQP